MNHCLKLCQERQAVILVICGDIWFKMVIMTKAIIQIKDFMQRRIVIPKEVWDIEGLQKDDYIEINVKKIEKPKSEKA